MTDYSDPFKQYEGEVEGWPCYLAGLPGYNRLFGRDNAASAVLSGDQRIAVSTLENGARFQGKGYDPLTGEEPGKPPHEVPGVELSHLGRTGMKTTYNAGDTASWHLIVAEDQARRNKSSFDGFLARWPDSLGAATEYIIRHTVDGTFWEFPPPGATEFELRRTDWLDSIPTDPSGKKTEANYPATYPLLQFMAARALFSASRVDGSMAPPQRNELAQLSDEMFKIGIERFMRKDGFVVYEDEDGQITHPASAELHSLAFIPPEYHAQIPFDALRERTRELETPLGGYYCTPLYIAEKLSDRYHGDKVWPFDQAFAHYGLTKAGLHEEAAVAEKIAKHIEDNDQELFGVEKTDDGYGFVPEGNDRQLWTAAAREYYAGRSVLSSTQWL